MAEELNNKNSPKNIKLCLYKLTPVEHSLVWVSFSSKNLSKIELEFGFLSDLKDIALSLNQSIMDENFSKVEEIAYLIEGEDENSSFLVKAHSFKEESLDMYLYSYALDALITGISILHEAKLVEKLPGYFKEDPIIMMQEVIDSINEKGMFDDFLIAYNKIK